MDTTTDSTLTNTRDLVMIAADELFKEGIRPTVANIRKKTQRGSATTINQALHEWWQSLSDRINVAESRPDIPEPVFEIATELWTSALAQADQTLAKERKTLKHYKEDVDYKLETALFSQQAAEHRAQELAEQLDQEMEKAKAIEKAYIALKLKEENQQTQIESLQTSIDQLKQEAQAQNDTHQQAIAREQKRFDALEKRLVSQLEDVRLEKKSIKSEFDVFKKMSSKTHNEIEATVLALKTLNIALSNDLKVSEQKQVELEKTLSQSVEEKQAINESNNLLSNEKDKLTQQFESLSEENNRLDQENKILNKEAQKIAKLNTTLSEKSLVLTTEKEALQKVLKQLSKDFQLATN